MIPAPIDGEHLWDETNEIWVSLIKTDNGIPDIDASLGQQL